MALLSNCALKLANVNCSSGLIFFVKFFFLMNDLVRIIIVQPFCYGKEI